MHCLGRLLAEESQSFAMDIYPSTVWFTGGMNLDGSISHTLQDHLLSWRVPVRRRGHWRQPWCQIQAGARDPKAPRQHRAEAPRVSLGHCTGAPAGLAPPQGAWAKPPAQATAVLRHVAGLFLRLPERSPISHAAVAPAGAQTSPRASRERRRKQTGASNLFAQQCLD